MPAVRPYRAGVLPRHTRRGWPVLAREVFQAGANSIQLWLGHAKIILVLVSEAMRRVLGSTGIVDARAPPSRAPRTAITNGAARVGRAGSGDGAHGHGESRSRKLVSGIFERGHVVLCYEVRDHGSQLPLWRRGERGRAFRSRAAFSPGWRTSPRSLKQIKPATGVAILPQRNVLHHHGYGDARSVQRRPRLSRCRRRLDEEGVRHARRAVPAAGERVDEYIRALCVLRGDETPTFDGEFASLKRHHRKGCAS
ncbi:MAG: hypothetical protein JWQ81_4689 [Amycolatopsis sp.]|nr:hypothetical protein [Amycolatopsis sp.]